MPQQQAHKVDTGKKILRSFRRREEVTLTLQQQRKLKMQQKPVHKVGQHQKRTKPQLRKKDDQLKEEVVATKKDSMTTYLRSSQQKQHVARHQAQKTRKSEHSLRSKGRLIKRGKERLKKVSKEIKTAHQRPKKEQTYKRRCDKFWKNIKGIKSIANIKPARKKVLTPKIRHDKDDIITSRKGMCNTFAKFYSNLNVRKKNE